VQDWPKKKQFCTDDTYAEESLMRKAKKEGKAEEYKKLKKTMSTEFRKCVVDFRMSNPTLGRGKSRGCSS
jgi:hypothetical protein